MDYFEIRGGKSKSRMCRPIECPCGSSNVRLLNALTVDFAGENEGVTVEAYCENGCALKVKSYTHSNRSFQEVIRVSSRMGA